MSKELIPEIKANYAFYNKVLRERKSVFDSLISIEEIGNNSNVLESNNNIAHLSLPNAIVLRINVKVNNHNFFQFKLRCTDLCAVPFFRYDSDGDTHRNYDESIPLEDQQVPAPHFHYYNENGINIAYKTPSLLDENETKALEDINICIKHFCHEANLRLNDDDFPEIQILPGQIPLKVTSDDPNSNVNFI
ncbi:hypothetical protein [Mucilaginibacter aquariorum]|uniref:Uncharacterized protein n=1 Tax=Mucilaginibacter aquariorum TaxID=2967225 RepID=A0ABT1TA73_9SPHI|nr:hypothetical protein [Mucilaginibacter aquariorum]MCQ6961444.1 hypothetical protein [Mucilaginibacter aquariorum]